MTRRPLVLGHRGAAGYLPENTMPSFERALELGADGLEFDVAITRDLVPVVIHDDTLDRTTAAKGPVEETLAASLAGLDAGSWRGLPTSLPTLDEVLAAFAHRTLLNLEIKESLRRAAIVEACAHAVARHGASANVVFSSFDHDALRLLRTVLPEARIGVLCVTGDLERAFRCAAEIHAENLHPPMPLVNPALVTRAHGAGLNLWTWTVNAESDIARMVAQGVDGIFSDYPDRVVQSRDRSAL